MGLLISSPKEDVLVKERIAHNHSSSSNDNGIHGFRGKFHRLGNWALSEATVQTEVLYVQ